MTPEVNTHRTDAAVLVLESVGFSYPGRRRRTPRPALRGADLRVHAGEAVALLGPNGSGKSTLLRIAAGLLVPADGSMSMPGAATERERRRSLGVVFQSPALDPHLSVEENLSNHGRLYGMSRRAAAAAVDRELEAASLGECRRDLVKTLSGGMRRRVDLCRALLPAPKLLLLDEPTTGLDPLARRRFLEDVERRRDAAGLAVLMSTHLVDEADRFDRVVLLHDGAVIADDAPAALRARLGARQITVQDGGWAPPDPDDWQRVAGGWSRSVGAPGENADLAAALSHDGVPFAIAPPTLADVFEQITGERLAAPANELTEDGVT